jgi:hypothetical protein
MTLATSLIPQSPEELSAEWLTEALRAGGHIAQSRVTAFTTHGVGVGVGFVGMLARIDLQYDRPEPNAPATMVAKFPSPNEASRQIATLFGLYEREVLFYRDLKPDVPMPSPGVYYADMDVEAGRYLLLLEDLNFGHFGDQVSGCTVEQARAVLPELAKLHAAWWANPKLDTLTYLPDFNDLIGASIAQAYDPSWVHFLERFSHKLSPELRAAGGTMGPTLVALLERFRDRPQTLCHSDFRVDNVFFGNAGSGRPVVVVDWQAPMRSWAAAYDAIYFITGGLPIEERRKHEDELLHVYHDALVAAGVADYSFDQLVEDARIVIFYFFAIIGVIAGGTLDMVNPRAVELFDSMVDRLLAAMADHNILSLLPGE